MSISGDPPVRRLVTGAATVALLVAAAAPAVAQDGTSTNPGMVRDGNRWLLSDDLAAGAADHDFRYGTVEGTPVMGDWNGDGNRTPGMVRVDGDFTEDDGPHTLVWYLRNSRSGGPADIVVRYGQARNVEDLDTPVVGDWNGDGVDTIGVVRPDRDDDTHRWLLRNANTSGYPDQEFRYGKPDGYGTQNPEEPRDVPVVGDWNGDGMTTPGVVRQRPDAETSRWLLRNANTGGGADHAYYYGHPGDRPITGDWSGDGSQTAGVLRNGSRWLLRDDHGGGAASHDFRYGRLGDVPVTWQ